MTTLRIRCFAAVCAICAAAIGSAQSLTIVDYLPGEFTDISDGLGEDLHLGNEDEVAVMTTIGNDVLPAGRVVVARNGGLGFDPLIDDLAPVNQPIPSDDAFGGDQATLPFWDDVGNDVGTVLWYQGLDTTIVQWHEVPFGDRGDTATFQIKIFDDAIVGDPPIYAQFIYADIEQPRPGGGISATIGYQDGGAGFVDVQWSFDTAGAVSDGTVLSIIPEPAAATLLLLATPPLLRRR